MDWDILTPSQPARLTINRKSGRWNNEEGWQTYFPEEMDTELMNSETYRTKFEGRKTIVETLSDFFEYQGIGLLQKAVEGKVSRFDISILHSCLEENWKLPVFDIFGLSSF